MKSSNIEHSPICVVEQMSQLEHQICSQEVVGSTGSYPTFLTINVLNVTSKLFFLNDDIAPVYHYIFNLCYDNGQAAHTHVPLSPNSIIWKCVYSRAPQEQEVKFQDKIFSKFQDIFVSFTKLKTQKMHVFLCSQILISQADQ